MTDRRQDASQAESAAGGPVRHVPVLLDEVLSVAGRITVLRHGRTVLTGEASERDVDELVRAMIGDDKVDAMALGLRRERSGTVVRQHALQGGLSLATITGFCLINTQCRCLHPVSADLIVHRGAVID